MIDKFKDDGVYSESVDINPGYLIIEYTHDNSFAIVLTNVTIKIILEDVDDSDNPRSRFYAIDGSLKVYSLDYCPKMIADNIYHTKGDLSPYRKNK